MVLKMYGTLVFVTGLIHVFKCQSVVVNTFKVCNKRRIEVPPSAVVKARSKIECAAACMRDNLCRASSYDKNDQTCEFFKDSYTTENCSAFGSGSPATILKKVSSKEASPPCTPDSTRSLCQYNQPFNETTCQCLCDEGFSGDHCENPPRDCSDFISDGYKDIFLPETDEKLDIVCSGGMMYILQFQRNHNAFTNYMNCSWNDFKSGLAYFGSGQFWIGNDVVHNITSKTNYSYTLVMYVINDSIWLTSRYFNFIMDDEHSKYTIHFSDLSIPAAGSTAFYNNTQLQSMDYNGNKCTALYGSSWWYPHNCPLPSPLTGKYSIKGELTSYNELYLNLKRDEV